MELGANVLLDSGVWSERTGEHRTPPSTGLALELERTRRATTRPRFAIRDHNHRELFYAP